LRQIGLKGVSQLPKRSCRSNGRFGVTVTGWLWPGPEILAINLIAENQPFDPAWHEKFRCNRHGRLMADFRLMTIKSKSQHCCGRHGKTTKI
jgi:hypothetical protein